MVALDQADAIGAKITRIFARSRGAYAVYEANGRVAIQYSDDLAFEHVQREELSRLNGLRFEIDSIVHKNTSRLFGRDYRGQYNARVAAALIVGLERDLDEAKDSLQAIKADVERDRLSLARYVYLVWASGFMLAFVIIFFSVSGISWGLVFDHPLSLSFVDCRGGADPAALSAPLSGGAAPVCGGAIYTLSKAQPIWVAAGAGVVGAYFSLAVGMRQRNVLTNLNRIDNIIDAFLRITIGAIAAGVLVLALRSSIVSGVKFGEATLSGGGIALPTILVVGFVAGFFERLVPDLLEKATNQSGGDSRSSEDGSRSDRNDKSGPRSPQKSIKAAVSAGGISPSGGPGAKSPHAQADSMAPPPPTANPAPPADTAPGQGTPPPASESGDNPAKV
jgi:hypothetical protein